MPDLCQDWHRGAAPLARKGSPVYAPSKGLRRGEARLARQGSHPLYGFNPQRIQTLLQGFCR